MGCPYQDDIPSLAETQCPDTDIPRMICWSTSSRHCSYNKAVTLPDRLDVTVPGVDGDGVQGDRVVVALAHEVIHEVVAGLGEAELSRAAGIEVHVTHGLKAAVQSGVRASV